MSLGISFLKLLTGLIQIWKTSKRCKSCKCQRLCGWCDKTHAFHWGKLQFSSCWTAYKWLKCPGVIPANPYPGKGGQWQGEKSLWSCNALVQVLNIHLAAFSKETCPLFLQLLQELQFLPRSPWTTAQRRSLSVEPLATASRWSRGVILDLTALISLMNQLVVSRSNHVLYYLTSLWVLNTSL